MWNRIPERPGSVCALVLTLLSSPVLSLPALAEIDRARFAEVLVAARAYAGERTLLFYCLRNNSEVRPMLFWHLHHDVERALERLRAVGSDLRQNAQLVETVLSNVRFAQPDDKNPALDPQCEGKDFIKQIDTMKGLGVPLYLRPAFRALTPP
jgi:hypothetical protein